MSSERPGLVVRPAGEDDLDDVMSMVDEWALHHPSAGHPRSRDKVRAAYFGPAPVARVLVATRRGQVIGMAQWSRVFDLFWDMAGGRAEWLYVRPAARGLGVAAALVAALCDDVRAAGGEYLCGGYGADVASLYERITTGWASRECYLSAEAFQVMADLAGRAPPEIVRGLPTPALDRVPARPRPARPTAGG